MSSSTHSTCGVLCTVLFCLAGCARLPQHFSGCYCKILEVKITIGGGGEVARKVSIRGLSTEWGDRIFQSIIVRGKNENL